MRATAGAQRMPSLGFIPGVWNVQAQRGLAGRVMTFDSTSRREPPFVQCGWLCLERERSYTMTITRAVLASHSRTIAANGGGYLWLAKLRAKICRQSTSVHSFGTSDAGNHAWPSRNAGGAVGGCRSDTSSQAHSRPPPPRRRSRALWTVYGVGCCAPPAACFAVARFSVLILPLISPSSVLHSPAESFIRNFPFQLRRFSIAGSEDNCPYSYPSGCGTLRLGISHSRRPGGLRDSLPLTTPNPMQAHLVIAEFMHSPALVADFIHYSCASGKSLRRCLTLLTG
jgi:hypothetical protein